MKAHFLLVITFAHTSTSVGFQITEAIVSETERVFTVPAKFGADPGRILTTVVNFEVGGKSLVPIGFTNEMYSSRFEHVPHPNKTLSKDLVVLEDVAFHVTFEEAQADVPILSFWEMGAASGSGAYFCGNVIRTGKPVWHHDSSAVYKGRCHTGECIFFIGAKKIVFQPHMIEHSCDASTASRAIKGHELCVHETTTPGEFVFGIGLTETGPEFSLWHDGNSTAELRLLHNPQSATEQLVLSSIILIALTYCIVQTRLLSQLFAMRVSNYAETESFYPICNFVVQRLLPMKENMVLFIPDIIASASVTLIYAAFSQEAILVPFETQITFPNYYKAIWASIFSAITLACLVTLWVFSESAKVPFQTIDANDQGHPAPRTRIVDVLRCQNRERHEANNGGRKKARAAVGRVLLNSGAKIVTARMGAETALVLAAHSFFPDHIGLQFKAMLGLFMGIVVSVAAARDAYFVIADRRPVKAGIKAVAAIQFALSIHAILFCMVSRASLCVSVFVYMMRPLTLGGGAEQVFPAMYITPSVTNYRHTSVTLSASVMFQAVIGGFLIATRHNRAASQAAKNVAESLAAKKAC